MLTIGIAGMGLLGKRIGQGIASLETAEVAAIADIDPETLQSAGSELDVPASSQYRQYAAMLDEEALDAVVIATPHTLHYEQIIEALDRELHVLCEKPLATDIAHAEDVVDRVERSGSTLMVGYQRHLDPAFITARNLVAESGSFPKFITAEITQDWIGRQRDAWRTDPALSGGGQLYDTGSHLLDAVCWVSGLTPSAVSAEMHFADEADRVDIQASLSVEFEEGTVASIGVSGDTPLVREHIHMWNDDSGIFIEGEGWGSRDVRVLDEEGIRRPSGTDEGKSKAEAFVDSIRSDVPPPATARDALVVTALTEAAYESAQSGKRVDIELGSRASR